MKKILLHVGITAVLLILDIILILFVPVIPPFFTILSALLFNPLYGGTANAVLPIVRYIKNPDGAYIILILMIIIMFVKGFLIGFLWKLIRDRKHLPYQIITCCIPVSLIVIGLLIGTDIKYMIYIAIFTAIFLISDIIICTGNFIKIFLCIAAAELIAVTLTTLANYDRFDIVVFIGTLSQTLFISAGISYVVTVIKNKSPI